MQKRKAKKPRNPTDATMRNIRALNKKVQSLESRFQTLEKMYSILCVDICTIVKIFNSKGK
jgi:hypothetical protein